MASHIAKPNSFQHRSALYFQRYVSFEENRSYILQSLVAFA